MKKIKLLYIINDAHPLKYFLKNHILYFNTLGSYEISVILNNSNNTDFSEYNINIFHFPIKRKPSIFSDIIILLKLISHLNKYKYDIIHSISPKSGLLSSIASFVTLQPVRIHTFTGQVWANYIGIRKYFYIFFDKIISNLNTNILTDSFSQKHFLLKNKIGTTEKIEVLNKGSICGVDLKRFNNKIYFKNDIRKEYKISTNDFVILYIGRLNFDKGIIDLVDAVVKLNINNIYLFIIGNDEENIIDYVKNRYVNFNKFNIKFLNETDNPEKYMSMSDVLCLPSYREGFGNVVIEAAAIGIPAIVSNIYGLQDSIINHFTGLFFNVKNIDDLIDKIRLLYTNQSLRDNMSINCINYISKNFDTKIISKELNKFYLNTINIK